MFSFRRSHFLCGVSGIAEAKLFASNVVFCSFFMDHGYHPVLLLVFLLMVYFHLCLFHFLLFIVFTCDITLLKEFQEEEAFWQTVNETLN